MGASLPSIVSPEVPRNAMFTDPPGTFVNSPERIVICFPVPAGFSSVAGIAAAVGAVSDLDVQASDSADIVRRRVVAACILHPCALSPLSKRSATSISVNFDGFVDAVTICRRVTVQLDGWCDGARRYERSLNRRPFSSVKTTTSEQSDGTNSHGSSVGQRVEVSTTSRRSIN